MRFFERMTERFDGLGQPGVAEQKAIKNVNRFRAAGVFGVKAALGGGLLTMGALVTSGARNDGFFGAVKAIPNAVASPFHNANGDWDMPLVDLGSNDSKIVITTGNGSTEIGIEAGTSAPSETATRQLPDRAFAEGNLADCDASLTPVSETIEFGETVYGLVQKYNPEVTTREAALNVAYNEFQDLNPALNPDSIDPGVVVQVPTGCSDL